MDEPSPFERFRAGCRAGRLDYQWDPEARAPVWYPRVVAPGTGTGSEALEWRTSAGLGTVYATTTIHRRGEDPANVCLVELDEGFRMMSRVRGGEAGALAVAVGLRVRVAFEEIDGQPWPVFEPAGDGRA